jgi:hypothetical protein
MEYNMYRILLTLFFIIIGSVGYAQGAAIDCPEGYICTISDTDGTQTIDSTTTVKSPPPSAISPTINTSNSDTCTIGVSGAVQTQILGISAGKTVRDFNCERLKNAKTLYDMGMKVAAVSVMCQDKRIFDAMMDAGTPCPYDGMIGKMAKDAWENDPKKQEENTNKDFNIFKDWDKDDADTAKASLGIAALFAILLAL